jgi:serine/threonine-protein kinase
VQRIGRYAIHEEIASGGMASVHLGQTVGDAGFTRTVAIKRLHPHVASAPGSIEMFVDEARVSSRVRHRNVVATLDVVRGDAGGELFLVMEYVHGVPLSVLSQLAGEKKGEPIPLEIAVAIMIDALTGLAAAHATIDELGRPLSIVHRDVSPQNILVGADGSARVLDFGIAKAAIRLQTTRDDQLKGKLLYMAPEQVLDEELDARTDQFAAGVVLWGLLTRKRLFEAGSEAAIVAKVLEGGIPPPSRLRSSVPAALDDVVLRALRRTREERFATCEEMATALRAAVTPATAQAVRDWVIDLGGDFLRARDASVARMVAGEDGVASPAPVPSELPTATATATLAEPPSATPTKRRRGIGLGALALVALATTIAVYVERPATGTATTGQTSQTSQTSQMNAASVVTTAPLPSAAPPDVSASVSVPAAASATTPAPGPTRLPPPRPAGRPAARKPSCAQLYTTDANGIQRVKAECL